MFNPLPVFEELDHFVCYFWLFLSLSPSISPPICFFFYKQHTSLEVYFSLWLIVSSSLSPVFHLSPLSRPLNHSVFSHTHSQRYMSGVITDHANAHETTRLESYCCWTHSEHTHTPLSLSLSPNHTDIPLMPHSLSLSRPALMLSRSLFMLASGKREDKLNAQKKKENSHWASAYFSVTMCVCVCRSNNYLHTV